MLPFRFVFFLLVVVVVVVLWWLTSEGRCTGKKKNGDGRSTARNSRGGTFCRCRQIVCVDIIDDGRRLLLSLLSDVDVFCGVFVAEMCTVRARKALSGSILAVYINH